MIKPQSAAVLRAAMALALITGASAQAAVISDVYVGTFSNVFADPSDPSGVRRGGKYVVKSSFDTGDLTPVLGTAGRQGISRDTYVVALDDVPGAPGATNTYQLFLPTQNYGILTQTGPDHFVIAGNTAQTAEIQFFGNCTDAASCATQFRGFEFESNFLRTNSPSTPAVTDLIFEQFTADVSFSGVTVTNHQVNLLDEGYGVVVANAGTVDVRSESNSLSGGQANPGVFFRKADPVIAEAGATPLVYSASQLSVTTVAGTELVNQSAAAIVPGQLRGYPSALDEQPRQADNDLGAGRTDQEDFLSFDWSVNGASVAGNLNGTRLNRLVTGTPSAFDNSGSRTVSNVNITVGIQASGLTSTVDTDSLGLTVTEAMTGLSDTDSVAISYQNAAVSSAEAGAPPVYDATHLTRTTNASVTDPDLVVNALIPGFEAHTFAWQQGGSPIGSGANLALAIQNSGLTNTLDSVTLGLVATDRAGTSANDTTTASYANALPTIGTAAAIPQGSDLLFQLVFTDPDLAVNALIAGFEDLDAQVLVDLVDYTLFFADLIATGSQLVTDVTLASVFGVGLHEFEVLVSDRAILASSGALSAVSGGFQFRVDSPTVPEPGSIALLVAGTLGLAGLRRRRRSAAPGGLDRLAVVIDPLRVV